MTRATDLSNNARALLDAIAIGESGGADDDAAYSVLFGGRYFFMLRGQNTPFITSARQPFPGTAAWPDNFPQWVGVWIGDLPTHAAGRYQFEPGTWVGLGGGSFDPISQDHKAWMLAQQAYQRGGLSSLANDLQIEQVDFVAELLHSTWTSLSKDTFGDRYFACLARITGQ